ncbi:unnamed protein product [Linum trigynum]|uniref:Uncharacterized protein n=1 Tax=Linum trigynum TaxID=586398 RepID=A0AAV2E699_9ROSI
MFHEDSDPPNRAPPTTTSGGRSGVLLVSRQLVPLQLLEHLDRGVRGIVWRSVFVHDVRNLLTFPHILMKAHTVRLIRNRLKWVDTRCFRQR